MRGKEPTKSGNEVDVVAKAPLCVFENNTGLRRYFKRAMNRRQRQRVRRELRSLWRNEVDTGEE